MKNLLIVTGWLISVTLTLAVTTSTLNFLRKAQYVSAATLPIAANSPFKNILASGNFANQVQTGLNATIQTEDARPILIAEFLEKHDSPLKPYDYYGQKLTEIADKYGLDYRLLPSIAMQESNLCKKIPAGTFNCLGLGIHARGTWGFPSFEANFEKAAEILRRNYIDQGLITPEEIQSKYTPHSNGSWQFAVNHFMEKLEYADF